MSRNHFARTSSWDPDSLAKVGYVTADLTGRSYVGPDALTLLSEQFAGGHCYAVVQDTSAHPNDVGLQFTPVEDNDRKRIEIRGTFWVNRTTWNLQSIDFVYDYPDSRVRDAGDWAQGGGFVEFGTLSTGEWLVTNWRIKMPSVVAERMSRTGSNISRLSIQPYLSGIQESGGMVMRVARDTAVLFTHVLPNAEVHVVSSDPAVDLAGAELRIQGSQFVGKSDENGRIELPQIFDGRYKIYTRFPAFKAFGDVTTEKVITVSRTGGRDFVFLPSANTWIRAACGKKSENSKLPTIYGSVRDKNGRITGGIVTMRWQTPPNRKPDKKTRPPRFHKNTCVAYW